MDDNFVSIALKNLPKRETGIAVSNGSDNWELRSDGTFKVDSYETIQQTETLAELEIDPINPTFAKLINLKNDKNTKEPKRTIEQSITNKKQRIE